MTPRKLAAMERRTAELSLRDHKKACLPCSREKKDNVNDYCEPGLRLAKYVQLMRRQEELLHSPPGPEMEQGTLW